ncbi:MAG: sulfate adenylyltransferase subunit CysD [Spirochaetales bacterium]|nr:sulfate adenylyltransferase subunit CysD [Spirochaetales bacterium]
MNDYRMNHLKQLESEAIYILREVAAQFERPVMLFSGGKDSICMAHIARKAFYPGKIPFPLMHVDTGHNFDETIEFRDSFVEEIGAKLIVRKVEDSIAEGRVAEEKGHNPSRNGLQTVTLLDGIKEFQFDCALGGARRDEEKARAKERFFSYRNSFGQWDPKNQRPELWNIFNGKKQMGDHFRVFPISNWTELDVWQYIDLENIPMPSLYFSHKRDMIVRNGVLLAHGEHVTPNPETDEKIEERTVRFRTIGDMTCTGAVESHADNLKDIINEVASTRTTERGGRADDKRAETAMEDRKKQGYF